MADGGGGGVGWGSNVSGTGGDLSLKAANRKRGGAGQPEMPGTGEAGRGHAKIWDNPELRDKKGKRK